MYKFSKFLPNSRGKTILSHENETSKIWHKIFEHMNYKYLQALNKDEMVEGLPSIKSSSGACIGYVVGNHLEHRYEKGKERRAHKHLYWYIYTSLFLFPLPPMEDQVMCSPSFMSTLGYVGYTSLS